MPVSLRLRTDLCLAGTLPVLLDPIFGLSVHFRKAGGRLFHADPTDADRDGKSEVSESR